MSLKMNEVLLLVAVGTSSICLFWLLLGSVLKAVKNRRKMSGMNGFKEAGINQFNLFLKERLAYRINSKRYIEETFDQLIALVHKQKLVLLEKIEKGEIGQVTHAPSISELPKELPQKDAVNPTADESNSISTAEENLSKLQDEQPPTSVSESQNHPSLSDVPPTTHSSTPGTKFHNLSFKDQVAKLMHMGYDYKKIAECLNRTVAEIALAVKLHNITTPVRPSQKKDEKKKFQAVG